MWVLIYPVIILYAVTKLFMVLITLLFAGTDVTLANFRTCFPQIVLWETRFDLEK